MQAPLAHAPQPFGDEDAIVRIEAHDVGHRAERDEVEQGVEPRLRRLRKHAAPPQFCPQGGEDIEHDADAGEVLARKSAARLVRIDDAGRARQPLPRQVMVGDQHPQPEFVGALDAVDARDAVVDRDQPVRPRRALRGELDDRRRQSVAVLEAVRHQVVDGRATGSGVRQCAQPAQADGAGGRAVTVVVGDDQHALAGGERIGEQARSVVDMRELRRRDQVAYAQFEFLGAGDAAGGEGARHRGRQPVGLEPPRHRRVERARDE